MEIRFDKRYALAASLEQAWAVLYDVRATAACMPGARLGEPLADKRWRGSVEGEVGPAKAVFNGELELLGRDSERREVRLAGRGQDRNGASASMQVSAQRERRGSKGEPVLVTRATVELDGELARVGHPVLMSAGEAVLSLFADNFRKAAGRVRGPGEQAAMAALSKSGPESTLTLLVQGGQAPGAAVAPHSDGRAPVGQREAGRPAGLRGWLARLFGRD
jgi:uncharacterized protein